MFKAGKPVFTIYRAATKHCCNLCIPYSMSVSSHCDPLSFLSIGVDKGFFYVLQTEGEVCSKRLTNLITRLWANKVNTMNAVNQMLRMTQSKFTSK